MIGSTSAWEAIYTVNAGKIIRGCQNVLHITHIFKDYLSGRKHHLCFSSSDDSLEFL